MAPNVQVNSLNGEHWDYHVTSDIEITVNNEIRYLGAWVKCGENAAIRLHNVSTPDSPEHYSIGQFSPRQLSAIRIFLEQIEQLCRNVT